VASSLGAGVVTSGARRRIALAIALGAGVVVALQSRSNGELAHHVGNAVVAAWLTGLVGALLLLIIVLTRHRAGLAIVWREARAGVLPWYLLTGGFFGTFFLITQSLVVPVMGVAVFAVGYIAGQTTGSLLADRIGLAGNGRQAITIRRVVASVLAVVAVAIALSNRLSSVHGSVLLVAMVLVAGVLFAPQQAFNGRVGRAGGSPFIGAFVNFVGALIGTSVVLAIDVLGTGMRPVDPWGAPWWAYLGGVLGMTAIAAGAAVVPIVGVLMYTLATVLGQLLGALILDLIAPTPGANVGVRLVSGVVLTAVAVALASVRRRRPAE